MTVLAPQRETELDAFDLDLRVVPADAASNPDATQGATPDFPTPMCPSALQCE